MAQKTRASRVLKIDRSKPFNPTEFIGKGWTIKKQDERSLTLTEIDLTKIKLEHMLNQGEWSIDSEAKMDRLKESGKILLDAKIFQTLWESQHLIPKSFQQLFDEQIVSINFDGTTFQNGIEECLISMYWDGQRWYWVLESTNRSVCNECSPTAVL